MNEIENIECPVIGEIAKKKENLLSNGIIERKRHFNQKYDIDFSFFDTKNTEEFAYFLGFFYADGYNNEKQGKITITLKGKDEEILKIFSNLFFGRRPIFIYNVKCQTNNTNEVCSLVVGNKSLSQLLISYGAPQCKTFKIRFPYWLDINLYRHFIRGYFDGDGSCEKCKNEYRISIASNKEFNDELQKIIKQLVNMEFGLIPQGKITILYKGGNKNTKMFLDWLYKDSHIHLQRKYNRYKELLLQTETKNNTPNHIGFRKNRNYWYFRLPSKFDRKISGGFKTKDEAFTAYKSKFLELEMSN